MSRRPCACEQPAPAADGIAPDRIATPRRRLQATPGGRETARPARGALHRRRQPPQRAPPMPAEGPAGAVPWLLQRPSSRIRAWLLANQLVQPPRLRLRSEAPRPKRPPHLARRPPPAPHGPVRGPPSARLDVLRQAWRTPPPQGAAARGRQGAGQSRQVSWFSWASLLTEERGGRGRDTRRALPSPTADKAVPGRTKVRFLTLIADVGGA